ncbi:thiamine-phosphate diphosphorylase [Amylibacter kogurei]|uniref:Thiamine-phosphate diphosphorylase n=1 Tax=Paramylibacter kogurei TaxID=1889778 RepID=A0A2G5K9Z7_9RHOB|nr:thiamine phosphate synthase [Amylibacter kogurei]PIB25862.1 thiamine-phosphate diphosphorylase [Amylibacter kogurei]
MTLDRFYPIFDSADWIARMLPLGIKLVQLRMKNQPDDVLRNHVRRAKKECAKFGCTLVVNDYWQIAIDEGCDFIHLGQEDLDIADMAQIRAANLRVGLSTHDDDELERALSFDPAYVALGPVYPTIFKKMKWTEQGLDRVTDWKKRVGKTPLVGIGGMSVERAAGVFDAGADIVSAVTDITLNADPEGRVQQWLDATR